MRKILILVACLAVVAGLGLWLKARATPARDDRPVLVLGTEASFHPFAFVDDKTGRIAGFDVDLAERLADLAGHRLDLRNMRFDDLLPELELGKLDGVVAALTITPERATRFPFTAPYFDSAQVALVPNGADALQTPDDLKDRTVAVQLGTTSQDAVAERFGKDFAGLKALQRVDEVLNGFKRGDFDAVVLDRPVALAFLSENGGYRLLAPPLAEEEYGIAFAPGGEKTRDAFDRALREMKASGELDQLRKKWFDGALGP